MHVYRLCLSSDCAKYEKIRAGKPVYIICIGVQSHNFDY